MKIILEPNEKQMEVLTKVSEITGVDYDGIEWGIDVTPDRLIEALEDMICEYHKKEEDLEDLKQNIEDNYEQVSVWKQVL